MFYGFGDFDPGVFLSSFNPTSSQVQPAVKQLQAALIQMCVLPAKRPSGKSNVDGLWGDDTKAAFKQVTGTEDANPVSVGFFATKYAAFIATGQKCGDQPPGGGGGGGGMQKCPEGTVGPFQPLCVPSNAQIPQIFPPGPQPYPAPLPPVGEDDNTKLYIGLGVGAAVLIGAAIYFSGKKKKAVENKRRKAKRNERAEMPRHLLAPFMWVLIKKQENKLKNLEGEKLREYARSESAKAKKIGKQIPASWFVELSKYLKKHR